MIFPFEVKKNGVYYPAGTEVPNRSEKQRVAKESPVVDVPGKVDDEPKTEEVKARKYSEEDLNIPYMKLKSLASKEGIKVDKSAKTEEIKELLRAL